MKYMEYRKKIEEHAKEKLKEMHASGFDHAERVYRTAKKIAKESAIKYDDLILHAACFLHDINQNDPHADNSAKDAEKFLKSISFPEEKIILVKKAIIAHLPNGQPHTDEAVLLHDADLLDFLGAVGIARLSAGSWEWFGTEKIKEITDIIKKYRQVYDSLILDKSKKIGKNKTIIMDIFIKQLESEVA